MLFWLFIIILSYLFFSLAYFGDKLILSGPPNPKLYTFYVSILGILVIFFMPFTKFNIPNLTGMIFITLEAIVYILGLYTMFTALEKFDVSRVMTTIGALQPILILSLTWIFWGTKVIIGMNFLAFMMLFLGGVIISIENPSSRNSQSSFHYGARKFKIDSKYLMLVLFSSLMFSLDYIFSKLVFLEQPFLQGLIWMRMFSFLFVLVFLFDRELKKQVFSSFDFARDNKKATLNKKTGILFLFTQSAGGIASLLQSFAISLVPVAYLAIINSLRGVQYIFLFIITLFFSFLFPKILKEEISKKIIFQKTVSILLIVSGLAILVL